MDVNDPIISHLFSNKTGLLRTVEQLVPTDAHDKFARNNQMLALEGIALGYLPAYRQENKLQRAEADAYFVDFQNDLREVYNI